MNTPNISESEWLVMESLWDHAPQSASEIASKLEPTAGWAINTVRTLLTRLVKKGALQTGSSDSGVRTFSPALTRDEVVRAESQSFMDRVFKGAAQPLMAHFATQSNLTPQEVKQLKKILDDSLKRQS